MCEKMNVPNCNYRDPTPATSGTKSLADVTNPLLLSSVHLQQKSISVSESSHNDLKSDQTVKIQNSKRVVKKRVVKRFDGVPENEILKMTLPDLISPNLDLLIVGINPSLDAAYRQHFYSGPCNHFWRCMAMAGIVPHGTSAEDDHSLLQAGIGITNVVERTTRCQADLKRSELVTGCAKLKEKISVYKPRIVAFNGKYIYEVFSGQKEFSFGLQPGVIDEGIDAFQFVMPSSSARCSQLPRAQDKLPFFRGLKTMLDLVRGDVEKVEEEDVVFRIKLKMAVKKL